MKKGWLVVNAFLRTEKFNNIYKLFEESAKARGIELCVRFATDLLLPVGEVWQDLPDFVLFWDKDISLARRLSAFVPVFNAPQAIEACDNKIITAEKLMQAGVKTPKTLIAPKTFEGVGYDAELLFKAEEFLKYPFVIKEAYGSFGKQVYLANNRLQAQEILQKIGYKDCLFQEFISQSAGRDIRVNVVGGKVICAMKRYNENDFRSNISGGGSAERVVLTSAQEQIAISACNALGLDFAGVDVLYADEPLVCEVNSNPSFQSTIDCTGVDLSGYILEYINERLANLR